MIIRYIAFAIPALLLVLLAFILSPILAGASVLFRRQTLPGWLQWFSTVDDTLDGGQRQHADKYPSGITGARLWWQRICWICRNPAQGFQAYMFGYSVFGTAFERKDIVKGTPGGGAPFMRYREYHYYGSSHKDDRRLFSYQRNIGLPGGYVLKLWFGWALKENIGRLSLKCVPISFGKQQ